MTEDPREADRVLRDVLAPIVDRPLEALQELGLPIGSAEQCAERLTAFAQAGVERVFVWPLGDEIEQITRFRERVVPLIAG